MNRENDNFDLYFTDLYEKHFNRIVKYLMGIVHDFCLSEDLAHDVFYKFYYKRIWLDGDETRIRSYILKSAKNTAIDYLRKQKRHDERYRRYFPEIGEMDDVFNSAIENFIIEGEIMSKVEDVLCEFPARNRRIFLEMVNESKSLNLVSDNESMSNYMVRKIYREIIQTLQEKLKTYRE